MHHFVGYSEEGAALYLDGCTDEVCALEAYVGQVIDLSPVADDEDHVSDLRDMVIARVGAIAPQAVHAAPEPHPMSSTAPNVPGYHEGASAATNPLTQRSFDQMAPIVTQQLPTPTVPAPAAPYWACYGRMEGGYYANNPAPGATFEEGAFTREAVQPAEQLVQDYYEGPTPTPYYAREDQISRPVLAYAGQWAHGNAGPKCGSPGTPGWYAAQKRIQCAKKKAKAYCCQKKTAQRRLACQRKTAQRQAQCDARAAACCDQGGGGGGGGGGDYGGGDGGGYCCQPQMMPPGMMPQAIPPGYCYVPYAPEPEEDGDDGYDCGDDEGDCDDGSFYAGQAPQGLGEGIGGALGGILGAFIGAPEIGAPLGAAMGGAIQGAACHHGGVSPGFSQGYGPSQPSVQIRNYTVSGVSTPVHGMTAPDGLFDPASGETGPIAQVLTQANAILRRNQALTGHMGVPDRSGTATATTMRGARVGQSAFEAATAEEIFDDTPRFQAAGFWDDPYGTVACGVQRVADWTYDKGDEIVRYAVGGGPGAKDFGPYSQGTIQSILQGLRSAGYDVEGSNPYDVDVKQHGVKLAATVHPNGVVTIAIASSNFYVTHDAVWEKVDPLMPAAG